MANRYNEIMATILHVDMDAFFASVEARDHPEHRGKPVIVGGARHSRRGVVATCSYEARAYGVRSAMPIAQALRLCPHGIYLPVDMPRYQAVSRQLFNLLEAFTPGVDPLSIDEAACDMTGCEHFYPSLPSMGEAVKVRIREELGLGATIGIAPNRRLAKQAADQAKPDGLRVVLAAEASAFLAPLGVEKLWGVGRRSAERLAILGIRTLGDLQNKPLGWLIEQFGAQGETLYHACRGEEPPGAAPHAADQSLGREMTFEVDVSGPVARRELARLAAAVGRRLRDADLAARTVTLKVRYADFKTLTRSRTLHSPTDDDDVVFQTAAGLLTAVPAAPFRLLGLYASGLTHPAQLSLFGEERRRLIAAIDALNRKYGRAVVSKGRESPPEGESGAGGQGSERRRG